MARRIIHYIEVTDDFDRDSAAEETVELGIDGYTFELDLTAENAKILREFLAPYREAAHDRWKSPPPPNKRKRKAKLEQPGMLALPAGSRADVPVEAAAPRGNTAPSENSAEYQRKMMDRDVRKVIRDWCHKQGFPVALTGQIPAEAVFAYRSAHPGAYIPESTLRLARARSEQEGFSLSS